jgi:NADH-quinone oxidoreductase subunit M
LAGPFRHLFLPLVGAAFILALRGDDEPTKRNARYIALWTTLATLRRLAGAGERLRSRCGGSNFLKIIRGLAGRSAIKLGVDGISLPFVILTTLLMPIASWQASACREAGEGIHGPVPVLEVLMIGTFARSISCSSMSSSRAASFRCS